MNIHQNRIEACIDVWSYILNKKITSRSKVRSKLEKTYRKFNVEPIRGWTKIDIFDKEMITLYIIGKYGLGLSDEDIPKEVFQKEMLMEKACEEILNNNVDPREVLLKYFNDASENTIFRVLRFMLTKIVLGWDEEEKLVKLLSKFQESFREYERNFRSFIRFYVALRIAEKIVKKEIRSRLEKEAMKHSLCLKFNSSKNAPSDELIREIAVNVFKGKEHEVNSVLNVQNPLELKLS